jgi:hypothetical protein
MPIPYVWMVLTVATNPFGWQPLFIVWLSILSVFHPLAFIWIYIFLSRFYAKFKLLHLERVAQKIDGVYSEAANETQGNSKDKLEELKAWIEFQHQIAQERSTPFTLQALLLFLTSSLPAVIQSGLLIRELFKT